MENETKEQNKRLEINRQQPKLFYLVLSLFSNIQNTNFKKEFGKIQSPKRKLQESRDTKQTIKDKPPKACTSLLLTNSCNLNIPKARIILETSKK